MRGSVLLDTNLLLLLIVGSASRDLIEKHKRLEGYTRDDFDLLGFVLAEFSELLTLPHVLGETYGLLRHIGEPAFTRVQSAFKDFVVGSNELRVASVSGCARSEFPRLGLTDALILHVCGLHIDGQRPTLLTADTPLADQALALGYGVVDYKREFQAA